MKMTNVVFHIENLIQNFPGRANPTLNIPALEIPKGQFVAVLGRSGSGKTTFLELLGLMNRCLDEESIISLNDPTNGRRLNYRDIWQDEKLLQQIRLHHYSFLFQHTMLFPNFTIPENIALSSVVQGASTEESIRKAIESLRNLDLVGEAHSKTNTLSGGQQQRVALARALNPDLSVLFADEPTGDLDDENANLIFQSVQSMVRERDGLTAIVATHNMDLAVKYADHLIIIPPAGAVLQKEQHQIELENLRNSSIETKQLNQILKKIMNGEVVDYSKITNCCSNELFDTTPQKTEPVSIIDRSRLVPDTETKKFFQKEQAMELAPKVCNRNTLTLLFVLCVVILTICFAKLNLLLLKERMNDPFARWLCVEVPFNEDRLAGQIKADLKKNFPEDIFELNKEFVIEVVNLSQNGNVNYAWGRTISLSDPLLDELTTPGWLLAGGSLNSEDDLGIIVSSNFIKDYGDRDSLFITMAYHEGQRVLVPIQGIVSDMPYGIDFLCTYLFYDRIYAKKEQKYSFYPENTKQLLAYLPASRETVKAFAIEFGEFVNDGAIQHKYFGSKQSTSISIDPDYVTTIQEGSTLIVNVAKADSLNFSTFSRLLDEFFLKSERRKKYSSLRQLYLFPKGENIDGSFYKRPKKANWISMYLNTEKLNHASKIKKFLEEYRVQGETTTIRLDISSVESRNNYEKVTSQTNSLALAIIFISTLCVSVLIAYVFYFYLYKLRTFLGLLKAIGVSNKLLELIYRERVRQFMLWNISLAIVSSFIVYASYVAIVSPQTNSDYVTMLFQFTNWYLFVFIVLMLLTCDLVVRFTSGLILKHTPGDLIYDRV